jgi:hypothetical protein
MNYDDEVVAFLAEKENLPLALEVADRIESVKDMIQREFWVCLRDLLNKELEKSGYSNWQIDLTDEKELCKNYAQCCIRPKNGATTSLQLRVAVEQEYGYGVYQLYYGIQWNEEVDTLIQQPLVQKLLKDLESKQFKTELPSWFLGWKYMDYYPRRKDFLLKMAADKTAIVNAVSKDVWSLFKDHVDLITDVNMELIKSTSSAEAN